MANALYIFIDELVYGRHSIKARIHITDKELLHLFNKAQELDDDLKKSVIDFLDAFLLKQGLSVLFLLRLHFIAPLITGKLCVVNPLAKG